MSDFIVAAPPYSGRSGGIMVLHELCTALNKASHRAGIAFMVEGSQARQGFKFAFSADRSHYEPNAVFHDFHTGKTKSEIASFISNAVVIYPDIVKGNPLNGRSYVSYVLGIPRFEVEAPFILSFSKLYTEVAHGYLFKPFISAVMSNLGTRHWTERPLSLTYIGKGKDYLNCSVIPGTILVEREWPSTKEQLGILLQNCKFFFSWDCVSATNVDAIICGAVPVLMHDLQIPREQLNDGELGIVAPVIEYTNTIVEEIRFIPPNVNQIDSTLRQCRERINMYEQGWIENVASTATTILRSIY